MSHLRVDDATALRYRKDMARRSSPDPEASNRGMQSVARKIAEGRGVPVTDVRYAEYRYFIDEERWTMAFKWEYRVDGEWREETRAMV